MTTPLPSPVKSVQDKLDAVAVAWHRVVDRHPEGIALIGWVVLSVAWGLDDPISVPDYSLLAFFVLVFLGAVVFIPDALLHSKFTAVEYIAGFMTIGVTIVLVAVGGYAKYGHGSWETWVLMFAVGAWTAAAAAMFDLGLDLVFGKAQWDVDEEVTE